LGFSPDLADALACTFATPDQSTQAGPWGSMNLRAEGMRHQTHHEWDPYDKA